MEKLHKPRRKLCQQQPDSFFELAIIEGDGTVVESYGEKKVGIGMNYKRQCCCHPLIMTLANTREVLYVANRSGNRPSHEDAAGYFDRLVKLCRDEGFRKVRLRGDTDFSQTTNLDRCHDDVVELVFGRDAMKNLVKIQQFPVDEIWRELRGIMNFRFVNGVVKILTWIAHSDSLAKGIAHHGSYHMESPPGSLGRLFVQNDSPPL